MVVGHPGDHGAGAVCRVAVDHKVIGGPVPILLHAVVVVVAKETIMRPSHATQTVVQVS